MCTYLTCHYCSVSQLTIPRSGQTLWFQLGFLCLVFLFQLLSVKNRDDSGEQLCSQIIKCDKPWYSMMHSKTQLLYPWKKLMYHHSKVEQTWDRNKHTEKLWKAMISYNGMSETQITTMMRYHRPWSVRQAWIYFGHICDIMWRHCKATMMLCEKVQYSFATLWWTMIHAESWQIMTKPAKQRVC